ncbi:MAG: bifunctional riboflavin kinase/FAD synthetase [Planctomycetota bacterium]|jgi:riboflavin kinase/FMN adenylyltransferase
MRIWNGVESYPEDKPAVVGTIGNYDGVHLGHQTILRRVTDEARALGLPSLLITFSPHPLSIVAPGRELQHLQTRGQKLESLRQTGLTDVLILEFSAELARLSGEEFFDQLLGDRVRFAAIHVGENFAFGNQRQGDLKLLTEIGVRRGFEVHGVAPVKGNGRVISSTAIRRALADGDVLLARRMLGRPYLVSGEVVRGDGRGRSLDCPTANVELNNQVLPRPGVYVTETMVIAGRFASVTNVGTRPTFGGGGVTLETHLLEFNDDLYDESIEVHFHDRIRDEMRFDDATGLADQLARDRAAATAFFQNRTLGAP